ncbi:MAG: DNA repair protein RadC [Deltaproteobacteria bacterium]|nr:DNA repair protein RadC [Deltaproteobacteria bacterium]
MTETRASEKSLNREHRKRLKERFRKGPQDGFSDREMLELLLAYALPGSDARQTAKALAHRFKGLRGIFDASVEELTSVEGITENAAVLVKLIKGAASMYLKERMMGRDIILSPREAIDYLNFTLSGEKVEKFLAIFLNARNEVLAVEVLHEGTINQTAVYPRKAIERAFKHNARAIIFVHNHPSGDATPSHVDKHLTKVLDRAALAVDLIVHDHLIIGKNRHFSARENGWIIGCPVNLQRAAET